MNEPTKNHKLYGQYLHSRDVNVTLAIGSAGTGKTYGAVGAAIDFLEDKRHKFVATRPNVAFAEEVGYLPGSEREKVGPWVRPIIQNFAEHGFDEGLVELYERQKRIAFYPLAFWQGMTFHDAFILIDECQNMSLSQLKGVLTRMGRNSKLVLCGDVAQTSELFANSGLAEFVEMVKALGLKCNVIEFTQDDILRSQECKDWIIGFEKWDEMKAKGVR